MELPALFYGLYRDVKRRTSKIVAQVREGADWMALVEAGGFLDTAVTPGLIVLEGPSPLLGGEPHFQMWLLWWQLLNTHSALGDEDVFERSLTQPWSVLGLVSHPNDMWVYEKRRYRPFLRAVRRYWDLFDAEGARYSNGSECGARLWSLPNTIMYVLANLGLSNEEMDPPWPPGGLPEIIDRTEQHLH